ncbi:MAG: alpha/beta hydrolase [Rhodospirillales bacterium]|nr:alpha/beta hydrolase [Rhodospirillales bacterium]MCW8861952.1 alpha/beta hydrolase [Rhodospirillales bacterium]MCW8970368.1 alpha/beta hydrolase [Rhodospirillales bacterium]MCW9002944.1 alpha/beta hydrolase [Rhodospirillales bacterium]MCW9038917.1 alpha/beta hydrolase [Rhodospirillales bacterium]
MKLTVNGNDVFAATGGREFDPALPAVVFIHGAAMDHTVWFMQDRYFAHHGRAFAAVDLPGHGRSKGEALTSIADLADWVPSLLDALGVERAALVGHSMGALSALEAASRHPDRVSALGLCGVSQTMPVHPDLLDAAQKNDHLAFDLVNSWAHGRRAHVGEHPNPGLWMMGGALRLMERSRPGVMYADLKACADYQGALAAAEKVRCPTLFVLGDSDMMSPAKQAVPLAAAINGSQTVVIPGCGHMMMVEKPHATIDALKQIL